MIREFTNLRRFDLVWAPDIQLQETNRYNLLEEPFYYRQFGELLAAEKLENIYQEYPYAIQPATDDRPFFFHFFKWAQTPQVLATFGHVWQPFGGSGYFVLIALLLLVSVFSLVLILIPLLLGWKALSQPGPEDGENAEPGKKIPTWKVLVYFGGIGMAFLFLEIPLIQRSILSFGQPAYAFGFVVLILLTASSLGSFYSRRFWKSKGAGNAADVQRGNADPNHIPPTSICQPRLAAVAAFYQFGGKPGTNGGTDGVSVPIWIGMA